LFSNHFDEHERPELNGIFPIDKILSFIVVVKIFVRYN